MGPTPVRLLQVCASLGFSSYSHTRKLLLHMQLGQLLATDIDNGIADARLLVLLITAASAMTFLRAHCVELSYIPLPPLLPPGEKQANIAHPVSANVSPEPGRSSSPDLAGAPDAAPDDRSIDHSGSCWLGVWSGCVNAGLLACVF